MPLEHGAVVTTDRRSTKGCCAGDTSQTVLTLTKTPRTPASPNITINEPTNPNALRRRLRKQ
jgi:hypothetical protein